MKAQGEAKNAPGSVILGYFCAALIAVMAIMMAIQVIGRYALQNPPDWTEELARVFFVYATFFGAALAVVRKAHLGIDVFARLLPLRARILFDIGWRLLACVILIIIVYQGYFFVERLSSQPLSAVPISKGYMFAGVPLGCVFILFYEILRIRYQAHYLKTGEDPKGEFKDPGAAAYVARFEKD